MTKKQLYFIIAVLSLILLYVLFMPTAEVKAPHGSSEEKSEGIQTTVDEALAEEGLAHVQDEVVQDEQPESVTLTGEFIGLHDGANAYQKKFKYLLLNDGEEVLRIDLRPLVGYSDLNIIEKLGVDRGDEVVVTGVMNDGAFTVESIE